MATNPFDQAFSEKGNPFDAAFGGKAAPAQATGADLVARLPILGQAEGVAKKVGDFANKRILEPAGKAIEYGHQHPLEAFQGVVAAPQRALRAAETGGDMGHAFMTPSTAPSLQRKVQTKLGIEPGGFADTHFDPIVGKALRLGEDIGNDPLTVAPVGKVADLAAKIPGVARAGRAVATVADKATGGIFNPDEYLKGLKPEARAEFEAVTNRAMDTVRKQKITEDQIVKAHAADIRKGVMPPEVARLFTAKPGQSADKAWQVALTDPETGKLKFGPGTRPQDVQHALFVNRAPVFKTQAMDELRKKGFFTSPSGIDAGATNKFGVPADQVAYIQKHLESILKEPPEKEGLITKAARGLMHRGNQAFLANPVPHAGNLSSLAYNEYGPIATLKGLGNAARVATGTVGKGALAKNIGELEATGAKSQYGNIFDELGLTRLAGIPGTEGAANVANKAIVPLERLSNAAQHKILNSTETGLRAAALDAERGRGVVGDQAAKNIHRTFGTDAPNAVTQGFQKVAVPFAKFHVQTAPGSVLRTLARNPARIANPVKAEQDLNNKGGPQYRSTVPGANAARMTADPEGYFAGNFGAIGQIPNVVGRLQKGQLPRLIQDAAERYVTLSPELQAIAEMLGHKRGQAGESGLQDLGAAVGGGYWAKNANATGKNPFDAAF
jgi:hypothetical protein